MQLISRTGEHNEAGETHTILSPFRPDDFRYLLAPVCPSRSSVRNAPRFRGNLEIIITKKKKFHLRLQPLPLLTVSSLRIQLRSATMVRISGKKGEMRNASAFFFASLLTGAIPSFSFVGVKFSHEKINIFTFLSSYIVLNSLHFSKNNLSFSYMINFSAKFSITESFRGHCISAHK